MFGAHVNSLLNWGGRPALAVAAALTLLPGVASERLVWSSSGAADPVLVETSACQADHPTAPDNQESKRQTTIRCQVENRDRLSNATAILFIVPDGNRVAERNLLVEFDSATIRDVLDAEALEWQSAKSAALRLTALHRFCRKSRQVTRRRQSDYFRTGGRFTAALWEGSETASEFH